MKVLLVVDMQNDFIDGSLGTKEAQAIVPKVVQKIKNFDGMVIATKDTHSRNYLETAEGKALPVVHCVRNTHGWNFNEDIKEALGTSARLMAVITKPTFGSLELIDKIKEYGIDKIDEIEIVGLCTDICVVSNALVLKANFYEDVKITVDSSCCAGVTPETHQSALETMKMCQINIV